MFALNKMDFNTNNEDEKVFEIKEEPIPSSSETILIYDPKTSPFGQLSNNAVRLMIIDEKQWSTVTNYILSNMLSTPIYRSILQTATTHGVTKKINVSDTVKQLIANMEARGQTVTASETEQLRQIVVQDTEVEKMNIYALYNHYLRLEHIEAVRTALEKAYNAKVSDDSKLADVLLETENRPIIYESPNNILGIGENGQGQNLIGKTLMQIRHNLKQKAKTESEEKKIEAIEEDIFVAYKALIILQRKLDQGSTLAKYFGQTAKEIVQSNTDEIIDDDLKPEIVKLYKRGGYSELKLELTQPGSLARSLQEQNLPKLKSRLEKEQFNTVCQAYIETVIRSKYPNMDDENVGKAINEFVFIIPEEDALKRADMYNGLCGKVIKLY